MEVCVEETRSTSLRARLSLLEIQAEAHLSNWDADAAEEVLKEYVGLNPGNQDMVRRLEEAEVGEISFPSSKGKPPILACPAPFVFLLGALVSIQFGHRVVPGFFEIVEASRAWTIGSALVSFLVAVLVGALTWREATRSATRVRMYSYLSLRRKIHQGTPSQPSPVPTSESRP